jgi:hypothetical protein
LRLMPSSSRAGTPTVWHSLTSVCLPLRRWRLRSTLRTAPRQVDV